MEISKELANDIVNEMKEIIGKDLNFINAEGKIIASTNKLRIGTYHEAGKQAILKDSVVVVKNDGDYLGAKQGVNLPLKYNNELIGVIGISGEAKEVEKYGQIIKRMSEILVKEAYLLKKSEEENEKEKIFLETLLFQNSNLYNPIIFSENIEDVERRKGGLIITGKILGRYNLEEIKRIFYEVKLKVKQNNGYIMLNQNLIVILLFFKTSERILDFLMSFSKKEYLLFGVGEIKNSIENLQSSYYEATEALEWGIKKKLAITFYEELDLELIAKSLTPNLIKIYRKKIFRNLSTREIMEFKGIFTLYEENNGALHRIAESLFIHVNTLQYKINKFEEKTGLDIRKYKDFSKVKLAFALE